MVFTGCRISEALSLRREDLNFKERTVRIKQLKKRSEFYRVIPVPSDLFWDIVNDYLNQHQIRSRLFELSQRHARNIVYAFTQKFLKRRIRPHAIRHSYALAVLATTKNLEVVRRLLGHSNYNTIKHYLDYSQKDLTEELRELYKEYET